MSVISYVESPLPTDAQLKGMGIDPMTLTLDQLNGAQPKMLDMNPALWKKGFFKKELDFEQLHYMVNSDYRIYSAGIFTDGIAKDDHWTGQDFFILDIDDGLTLYEAKDLFQKYQCLITTTKSHQVEKNNLVCDRFRVIIPTMDRIKCTQEEYRSTMKLIHDIDFPFADEKCKDPSRIYFGKSGAEFFYFFGKKFDFDKYLQRVQKKKAMNTALEPQIKDKQTRTQRKAPRMVPRYEESTQKGFYDRTWCTPEMLTALKFDEKFVSGNRNNVLLSWTKFFKGLGFGDAEVREVIFYINNSGDSVEESEIEKTIFRSQRIQ